MWFKYGLKAQKLLAQGIALGVVAISKAPCKGKSFVNYLILKAFALTGRQVCVHKHPGRCPGLRASAPSGRAACVHCPGLRASALSGRAACVHCPGLRASAPSGRVGKNLRNLNLFLKENVPLNTPMYPYVPTANSGCRNFAL